MKRYINTVLCAMAMFCVACNDTGEEYGETVQLSFSPAVMANTRTAAGIYPQDIPFGVWASCAEGESDVFFMSDVQVSYSAAGWLPAVPYMWESDLPHTFYACSPWDCGAVCTAENGIMLDGYNTRHNDDIDFMFTYPVENRTKDNTRGCVPLPFVRALAKVEFKLRSTASDEVTIILRSLKAGDIVCEGDFRSLPSPHWVLGTETVEPEFCKEAVTLTRSGVLLDAMMLMPQAVNSPVAAIVDIYNADGTVRAADVALETDKLVSQITPMWKVGKYYSYTLDVSPDDITFITEYFD